MFYSLIRPLLFSLDPEKAHELTLHVASISPAMGKLTGISPDPRLSLNIGQNRWGFPVGLAAGLDKNAEALPFFAGQGFGSIECGTITLRPQIGNPRPRLFRYPSEQSLRNAMGFPNHGLLKILPRLAAFHETLPIGANIGKNKDTSPEESIEELSILYDSLQSEVDYFVVNVSSPNTPGLRALQERSYLSELFTTLNESRKKTGKDLFLKIAPDLSSEKVIEMTHLALEFGLTGLIATNTTIMPERGIGGVSGTLLKERSRKVRQLILNENLPLELIGVGGIGHVQDIFDYWMDGGKALEVYTAYVYQGPQILKDMKTAILKFLDHQNLSDLESFFQHTLPERQDKIKNYRANSQ